MSDIDNPEAEAAVVRDVTLQAAEVRPVAVKDEHDEPVEQRIYGWSAAHGLQLIDTIDLERRRTFPEHKRGTVKVTTPDALSIYGVRHLNEGGSTLWMDPATGKITVVFNDHDAASSIAGWADHRAELQLVQSPEWKAWAGIHESWLSQADLAAFLDDHQLDVIDPDGSALMDITRTFHATEGATFKSARNDGSGEQTLVYEQQVDGRAGRDGTAQIPTDLTLRLRPWLGVDPVDVAAKFRFRINGGSLVLGIRLIRAEEHSRVAVEQAAKDVSSVLDLPVIEGTAPAARR